MTRILKAVLSVLLLGLFLSSTGCSGFVTASSSYRQDDLPTDEDGVLTFLGYVPTAGGQVRMQARGATSQPWTTIETVNATSSPTYADSSFGPVRGYHWFIRYAIVQLAGVRQGDSLDVWVRFVARDPQNNDVILPSSSGDLNACYFGARRQGTSASEAAEGCFTNNEIRVSLNPPRNPPDPPPDCPPDLPNCHEQIEGESVDPPGVGGEAVGGGDPVP